MCALALNDFNVFVLVPLSSARLFSSELKGFEIKMKSTELQINKTAKFDP